MAKRPAQRGKHGRGKKTVDILKLTKQQQHAIDEQGRNRKRLRTSHDMNTSPQPFDAE